MAHTAFVAELFMAFSTGRKLQSIVGDNYKVVPSVSGDTFIWEIHKDGSLFGNFEFFRAVAGLSSISGAQLSYCFELKWADFEEYAVSLFPPMHIKADTTPPQEGELPAPKRVLSAPSAHSLQECFAELKFGRKADQQIYLQSLIEGLNK